MNSGRILNRRGSYVTVYVSHGVLCHTVCKLCVCMYFGYVNVTQYMSCALLS